MKGLLDRIGFAFQVNYHSNGQWLLYAEGWQIATPTADDPIYYAMSGNLDDPAIEDFHPGLSSDVLYVTNGETTDYAHAPDGTLAWTPELLGGLRRLRLRVPRRRGARPGGVRAQSALRPLGRRVGQRSRRSRDGDRHRDQAVLPEERGSVQGRDPGRELYVRLLLRRPAAGPGGGQAQPRRGDAQVQHQRGAGAERADERVERRRALRPRRRLLPPAARHGHRHRPRRLGRGLVRGRWRGERPLHLPGRLGDRQRRAGGGGRGLHGRIAGPGAGPALPRLLPRCPRGERGRRRRLRRRRPRSHGAR